MRISCTEDLVNLERNHNPIRMYNNITSLHWHVKTSSCVRHGGLIACRRFIKCQHRWLKQVNVQWEYNFTIRIYKIVHKILYLSRHVGFLLSDYVFIMHKCISASSPEANINDNNKPVLIWFCEWRTAWHHIRTWTHCQMPIYATYGLCLCNIV